MLVETNFARSVILAYEFMLIFYFQVGYIGSIMDTTLTVFEDYNIRRVFDETTATWLFSVIDIIQALTQQPDYQLARNYWKVLKTL